MANVRADAVIDLGPGTHTLVFDADTVDNLYHLDCFFTLQFELSPWGLPCTACGHCVEWVRSAKRSQWRLHKGSALTTQGRYVFAPDNQPFFKGWHFLWSRDWTSDDGDQGEELGEYQGRTQWDNGRPPNPYPDRAPVNPDNCLELGEEPAQPSTDLLIGGFPSTCYGVRPELPDFASLSWLRDIAYVLALHYDSDPQAKIALQAATGSSAVVTEFPVVPGVVPGGLVQVADDAVYVCLDGTTDFQQLALQAAYLLTPPSHLGAYGTSLVWWVGRQAWVNRLIDLGVPGDRPLVLCGHSMGGVLAALIGASAKLLDPARRVVISTYGMPPPGDTRLRALLTLCETTHVTNVGDPVPCFPSVLGLGWPTLWVPFNAVFVAWDAFRQPTQRLILDQFGGHHVDDRDWYQVQTVLSAAAFIVAGFPVSSFPAHGISAYLVRLVLAAGNV